jgi:hypothetical protein
MLGDKGDEGNGENGRADHGRPAAIHGSMDPLTLFGLVAVTAMLVFYALEDRSPWCVLAFAGACALGSVYGFLQGAWPFGLVEAVWSAIAVRRWRMRVTRA